MPSASVRGDSTVSRLRERNELTIGAAPLACTPTRRTRGASALSASAMPLISPPPPIGTTSVSSSGTSSRISSAIVPWPSITAGSSKGCTSVAPRSRASSRARACERS